MEEPVCAALLKRIAALEEENRRLTDENASLRLAGAHRDASQFALFDSLPGLMCTLTPDMHVEFVNRPLLDYFGMTLEEIQGWKSNQLVHPDDLDQLIEENRLAAVTGAPYIVERRCLRHDGTFRWLQMSGHPVRDSQGAIIRWYSLLVDIEDRKRAQAALEESEKNLRRIINSMPTLVWSTDAAGEADFFNDEWLNFTGLELDDALGKGWMAALHPNDAVWLAQRWEALMLAGTEDFGEWEVRLRRMDGRFRWFLVRTRAFRMRPARSPAGTARTRI